MTIRLTLPAPTALTVDGRRQAGDFICNAAGQTTQMKVGAGSSQLTEEYSFDAQTRLMTNQKVKRADGTELFNQSYGYQRLDAQLNLLPGKTGHLTHSVNHLDRGKDRKYDYDALGRLTKASGGTAATGVSSASSRTQNYIYDRYGNRTNVTSAGQSAGNQIPTESVLKTLCKRVILETAVWQSVFKYDGELVHRSAPVGNRHCPPFADISQG